MKKPFLLLAACALLFAGCKKEELTPNPSGSNTGTGNSGTGNNGANGTGNPNSPAVNAPYYADFTFDGVRYSFKNNQEWAQLSDHNHGIAGYATNYNVLFPSLRIAVFTDGSIPTHSELLALQGKTLGTDYSGPFSASFSFHTTNMNEYWDNDTSATNFLKVDSIVYAGRGLYMFQQADIYEVTGTFQAQMTLYPNKTAVLENGRFKTRLSRRVE